MDEYHRKCIEQQLRNYRLFSAELTSVEMQINSVEGRYDPGSISSIDPGKEFVVGGRTVSATESQVVPYLDQLIPLQVRRGVLERYLKRIDDAMGVLTPDEKQVIQKCVIERGRYKDLPYSYRKSKRLKKRALEKLAQVIFNKKCAK